MTIAHDVAEACEVFGITTPAPVLDAIAAADHVLEIKSRPAPGRMAGADLLADPAGTIDRAVEEHLRNEALRAVFKDLPRTLDGATLRVVRDAEDDVVKAARPKIAKAYRALSAASAKLPEDDLSPLAVLNADAGPAWKQAEAAVETLNVAVSLAFALAGEWSTSDQVMARLGLPDIPSDVEGWVCLVRDGHTINLRSKSELDAVAAAAKARAEREAAERAEAEAS